MVDLTEKPLGVEIKKVNSLDEIANGSKVIFVDNSLSNEPITYYGIYKPGAKQNNFDLIDYLVLPFGITSESFNESHPQRAQNDQIILRLFETLRLGQRPPYSPKNLSYLANCPSHQLYVIKE